MHLHNLHLTFTTTCYFIWYYILRIKPYQIQLFTLSKLFVKTLKCFSFHTVENAENFQAFKLLSYIFMKLLLCQDSTRKKFSVFQTLASIKNFVILYKALSQGAKTLNFKHVLLVLFNLYRLSFQISPYTVPGSSLEGIFCFFCTASKLHNKENCLIIDIFKGKFILDSSSCVLSLSLLLIKLFNFQTLLKGNEFKSRSRIAWIYS